jgi:hypothetical protein
MLIQYHLALLTKALSTIVLESHLRSKLLPSGRFLCKCKVLKVQKGLDIGLMK